MKHKSGGIILIGAGRKGNDFVTASYTYSEIEKAHADVHNILLQILDDGKITESGTHEELLALKGTYYKLSELQTKALAMRGIEG